MADFDPDAFLAEPEDDFDPDAFLSGETKTEPQEPPEPTIDAGSATILKGSQGILGGWLDELSGGIEALGSAFGVEGLGGPTGQIGLEERPRTFAEAYEEGQRRKQEMLARAEMERPILSQLSETGGAILSGLALPAQAATTAGKIGTGAALSGMAGAGYTEGGPVEKVQAGVAAAPIGAIIPATAAGVSRVASSKAAKKVGREALKKFGRVATTMPEDLIERYMERGRLMDSDDSLIKVAEEVPESLNTLRKITQEQSAQSRDILESEGVKVPRFEIVRRLRELIASVSPKNTSASPVLAKLQQRLDDLTERPGTISDVGVSGTQTMTRTTPGAMQDVTVSGAKSQVVPTSTRTIVGGAETPAARTKNIYGIPEKEARGTTRTLEGIDEVNISGNKEIITPSQSRVVVTTPAETVQTIQPTTTRTVVTTPGYRPPDMLKGGEVKDIVQDIGDFIKTAPPGYKDTTGGKLAKRAYGYLQEPIKEASPAYTAKMKEIDEKMRVLDKARRRFKQPEATLSRLRAIGGEQERAYWARQDLQNLENLLGANYTERVKDAITLDAFTKPGVQGSRSVNIGRSAGQSIGGPVGETIGGAVGATVDYYGRSLLKKGIDLQQRIQYMPPQYRAVFDRAVQKGGNAAAVMHHTLFTKDPEYRKLMQEMDEQQE